MLKNDPPSETTLDELRTTHGELVEIEAEGLHVVLAKPLKATRAAIAQRFSEQSADPKQKLTAITGLFKACCVYPPKDELASMLAEEPMLPNSFGNELVTLMGVRTAQVKKG